MRRERFDKMNVIPFIDIVLVLLVIVLATASFVANKAIRVDLPQATSQKPKDQKSVSITITREGEYFFDKKPLSPEALKHAILELDPQSAVVSIHTDRQTPFQYFVDVIDFMKAHHFTQISIITRR